MARKRGGEMTIVDNQTRDFDDAFPPRHVDFDEIIEKILMMMYIFDDYARSRTSTTRVEGSKRTRDKETAATVLRRENGPLASPSLRAHTLSGPFLSPREVDIGGGELRRR